jgi:hypothetical protein
MDDIGYLASMAVSAVESAVMVGGLIAPNLNQLQLWIELWHLSHRCGRAVYQGRRRSQLQFINSVSG